MNNYSKQRELILEVIKRNRIHPTAEEIYQLVVKEQPKISKSTVYRNIHILLEQGKIKKIPMTSGSDRYDYFKKVHNHMICEECGRVFDIFYNFETEKILEKVQEQINQEVELTGITIYGICESCKSDFKN